MTCCFRCSSKDVIQTRGIWTKNNIFVFCDGVYEAFSSSSFVVIQFRRGRFNCFASSKQRLVHLLLVCNPQTGYKCLVASCLHLKKSIIIIIIAPHVTFSVFCIGVFTLFHIYLRIIIFTLFVDRINL